MGQIERVLAGCDLPGRDGHNGRIFVDMSENIHIHYREHRFVFSTDEFMEFADAINKARNILPSEVANGYREGDLKRKAKIIGGSQTESIKSISPPTKSAYFDNRLQIEKQVRGYGDVIHLHYRDYRLVMRNWETWVKFCNTIAAAFKNSKKSDFV